MVATTNEAANRNKKIVENFQAQIIAKNWDEAKKHLHADVKVHFPTSPLSTATPSGKDGVIEMFQLSARWFDFIKSEVKLWAGTDDSLFEVVELHFEHTGDFFGLAPTHKRFSINGLGAWRFKDGKISDHWGQYDMLSIPRKLGLELPPGALFPQEASVG